MALCFQTAFAFPLVSWMLGRSWTQRLKPSGRPELGGQRGRRCGAVTKAPGHVCWASAPQLWCGAKSPPPSPSPRAPPGQAEGSKHPHEDLGRCWDPWSRDGTWVSARPGPACLRIAGSGDRDLQAAPGCQPGKRGACPGSGAPSREAGRLPGARAPCSAPCSATDPSLCWGTWSKRLTVTVPARP